MRPLAPVLGAISLVLASACGTSGVTDDDGRSDGSGGPPVSKAEAIAQMESNCASVFAETAQVPRDLTTTAGIVTYVSGMSAVVARSIALTTDARVPPGDGHVLRRVKSALQAAETIFRLGQSSISAIDVGQAEEHLRRASVVLVEYGAAKCLPPPRTSDPAAAPAETGTRVTLPPSAVVSVGPPGIDNNRIVAGVGAVWVGLKNGNAVVRIDPRTNRVVATVPLEQSPAGQLIFVDGYLWASGERGLVRIDPRTNTVDRRIPRSVLSTSTNRVWVTTPAIWSCAGGTGVVRRADPETGRILAEVQLPTSCFELSADDDNVWVGGTSFGEDRSWLHRIDARTTRLTASVEVPGGGRLPVAGAGSVWLDTTLGAYRISEDATRVVGSATRPGRDVAFVTTFGSGAFWTARESEQLVLRVDADTLHVDEFVAGPGANALAVADGTLWVSNSDAGTVMRFDVDPWRTEGGG